MLVRSELENEMIKIQKITRSISNVEGSLKRARELITRMLHLNKTKHKENE